MHIETIDKNTCPFCQLSNACGIAQPASCWCVEVEIPAAMINILPPDLQQEVCICLSCVESYHRNSMAFIAAYKNSTC